MLELSDIWVNLEKGDPNYQPEPYTPIHEGNKLVPEIIRLIAGNYDV